MVARAEVEWESMAASAEVVGCGIFVGSFVWRVEGAFCVVGVVEGWC